MGEHRVREINTNMRDCLPLSFINGHCKADSDRELFSLKLEGEYFIIRRAQRYAWEEDSLSCMFSEHNFRINGVPLKCSDYQPCSITQAIRWINISEQNH